MDDLKFTSAHDYVNTPSGDDGSRDFVIALGNKLDEMRACGKIDTEEYRILSDEWQALAHDLVVVDILGDDQ